MTQEDFRLEPFFWNDRNRTIRPWAQIGISLYFWQRWVPLLGPQYTVIVLDLRIRATQHANDTVVVSHADLAATTGLSRRTIERLLAPDRFTQDESISRFLTKGLLAKGAPIYSPSPRTKTVYRVAMDDPLHPADDPRTPTAAAEDEAADMSADERRLLRALQDAIPTLYASAALKLIHSCGQAVVEQQLDWFPHRDSSWATNDAAAFVAYCRDSRPMPTRLKGEAAYERSLQAAEAAVLDQIQQEQQQLPLGRNGLTESLLAKLPPGPRLALRGRFQVDEADSGKLHVTCSAPGYLTLLKAYRAAFVEAGRRYTGQDVTLVYIVAGAQPPPTNGSASP